MNELEEMLLDRKTYELYSELFNREVYELSVKHDSCKSFYGKAKVVVSGKWRALWSYQTLVCIIYDTVVPYGKGTVELMDDWDRNPVTKKLSHTTVRHVREFLRQCGFYAETRKQIWADYGKKWEPPYGMEDICGI